MQYILSEDEMKTFKGRIEPSLFEAVKKQTEHVGNLLIEQIGCENANGGYCDDCPLSGLYHACKRSREYSQ